ncbi:hypothetical protein GCM10017691_20180 [Pseudonocardia petroleophila]|uniref:Uncharacterized protein n=1 Tax=Pseudonocardia petroleophila TaxID=37331 RepID=A0A7G7MGS6_9PSEU|nr:hypothetical protein [Pseudonocardia petroleophila]QNG51987.1 hypothetical protein H6H00_28565 [Pseudonocardia petroleophila]
MSTLEAVLVFGGIPLAIVGVIAAAVFAAAPRRESQRPEPPVGIIAEQVPCDVQSTDDGREVHDASDEPSQAAARVCWTVRCAECGIRYSEGPYAVHFTGPVHGISVASAHGWRLAGARMRCPKCA